MKEQDKNVKDPKQKREDGRAPQPQQERAMDDPGRGHGDPMDDHLPDRPQPRPAG